ncbi:MAG: polysaccharide deacetylase family protein [Betaproteobacteria bacterium]
MPRDWQPTTLIKLSAAVHAGAGVSLILLPGFWLEALSALAANHALLCSAGLTPRSRLLGPNLSQLPKSAIVRREIALTIDDGPDPEITPLVLDLLDENRIKATFFCIGALAARYPGLVREIAARGHAVENHSQHHLKRFSLLGPRQMFREVAEAQYLLTELTGRPPRFFRPTAGLRNPFLEPILAKLDLRLATWNRRAYDTLRPDPEIAHRRLTGGLGAGDILLLHDGNAARHSKTPVILPLLPLLIGTIRESGLNPVTLERACAD